MAGRVTGRDPESFQQDADDVAALLGQLCVDKDNVLGFSNGASTTLQLAIRHRGLVNRIIVISGAYRRDGFVPGFFDQMPRAMLDVMPDCLKEAYLKVAPDKTKLAVMFEKDKQRMMDFADWSDDELRSIKARAMIMSSLQDVVLPEHTVRMSRLIAHSRLMIRPGRHGEVLGAMEAGVGRGYADVVASLVGDFISFGICS